ncbi:hypothetical protein [Methylobacterium sp. Leaf117]|uniref:hypothetical protein n=1 Tax=Methylobacterium sp. Leaf117 TaxID=1736260 RepID=UPI0006F816F0|nr:hypothetical protein [Methylobacterium sp. Leaf117]KQP83026.1 hypothetical protein ASF57_13015 [Methylobacterium sp. Leaf117]
MTAPPDHPDVSEARLFAAGNGVLVCRYPVGTDLPIPLGIAGPAGVGLLTWAFTGFGADARDPAGLLVLTDAGAALAKGGTLVLATHFREVALTCPKPRPVAELTAPARAALAGAVLAAVTPATLDALATLFPLLAPAFLETPVPDMPARNMPARDAAPRLAIARDSDSQATLSGSGVPNYLLVRAGTTWSCARVVRADLRFGPAPETRLGLETVWGNPRDLAVAQALLLGTGSVTPATIGKPRG